MKHLIPSIKEEMLKLFRFNLTDEQVQEFLDGNPIECFDTLERGDLVNFLAEKITGMSHPCNGDSDEYTNMYYKKLKENAPKLGYEIL